MIKNKLRPFTQSIADNGANFYFKYECNCKRNNHYIFYGNNGRRGYILIEEAKSGEYGDNLKELFKAYPDGTIDINFELYHCEECGGWENERNMSFHIPLDSIIPDRKDLFISLWPEVYNDETYNLSKYEKNYNLNPYWIYPHICEKCGSRMVRIPANRDAVRSLNLTCKKCHSFLKILDPPKIVIKDGNAVEIVN